jgi:RNA polymerase sigma-70 factor (ECF subfamily)
MTSETQIGRNEFPTTSWTLVAAAGDSRREDRHDALVRLCEHYWYPVYAYVRRRGYAEAEAQDLTQDFFVGILEGRYLERADPNRGRFRSFLLNSCKFFLSDQADRARAETRWRRNSAI